MEIRDAAGVRGGDCCKVEKDGASTGCGGWAGLVAVRVFAVVEHNAILCNPDGIWAGKKLQDIDDMSQT